MKKRALVADDSDASRRLIRMVLEREEIEVVEARDGAEALEILTASQPFDLFVIDLMMPGASGHKVIDHVRKTTPHIPCLVVSAAGRFGLGVLHPDLPVIRKPFNLADLAATIRSLVFVTAEG